MSATLKKLGLNLPRGALVFLAPKMLVGAVRTFFLERRMSGDVWDYSYY